MKKSIAEYNQLLAEKRAKIGEIQNLLESEKRGMTDAELASFEALETEIRSLSADKAKAEAEFRLKNLVTVGAPGSGPNGEEKEVRKNFSLHNMVRAASNAAQGKQVDGFEAEMMQEADKEASQRGFTLRGVGVPENVLRMIGGNKRAVSVTGQTTTAGDQGGVSVATEIGENYFVEALQAKSGLGQLGATFVSGLQGDFQVPFFSNSSTAIWEGETHDTDATQLNMDSFKGQPKRVSARIPYTKQMLVQSSLAVESLIVNDLINGTQRSLDQKAISGSGTGSEPKGILTYSSEVGILTLAGANGSALTYKDIVALETLVADANGAFGKLGYYTNSKVRGALKGAPKESGGASGYIWNSSDAATPLNGYGCAISNNVPKNLVKASSGTTLSAIIFANWEELFLMQWGGLDIIVDPYSLKTEGIIDVQIDSFWDVKLRRRGAFAYCKQVVA
jgi:HK97 family phage major capsid protein